jgi:hypothetical protein
MVAVGVSSPMALDGGKAAPSGLADDSPTEPIKIASEVIATPAFGIRRSLTDTSYERTT